MTAFVGTTGVNTFRAVMLKSALKLYRDTGIKPNRAYTPTNMLALASQITGNKFKRGQFTQAIEALDAWIKENGTTGA